MKRVLTIFLWCFVILTHWNCLSQVDRPQIRKQVASHNNSSELVGGGCDGCELMYIGIPGKMDAMDTSAGWTEQGQKLLVTGIVYKQDGKTPAPDVIIYYWQTDNQGYYSPGKGLNPKALRHGHIRGWLKTGKDGKYAI